MTSLVSLALGLLVAATPGKADPLVLALVVGSNQGAGLSQPPLHYADDDAARYLETFEALYGPESATLLTAFDRDSARLFGPLVDKARAPTKANVLVAAQEVAAKARAAEERGREVELYFVFAGHGDVDRGSGFLSLADGPFTSEDLEGLLRAFPAKRKHVILDSCNSFFVISPRRPGGRRFATPSDAAQALARRMPEVGVFLSTSAEAEVYEWSELQSGIFSHAVRSGMLGAADADGDGQVSYEELAAFVETAAAPVKNPLMRPKVYARGPGGDDRSAISAPARSAAPALTIHEPGPVRLTVRDESELRWLDVHAEPGAEVILRLPAGLEKGMVIERGTALGKERLVAAAVPARLELGAMSWAPQEASSRSAQEQLQTLFSLPFGARALESWRAERAAQPEPVYGITREDGERMDRLLGQLADTDRSRRLSAGILSAAGGFGLGVLGALSLRDGHREGYVFLGTGAVMLGVSALAFLPSSGEKAWAAFREEMAAGTDPVQVVARTEARLQEMLGGERLARRLNAVTAGLMLASGIGLVAVSESSSRPDRPTATGFGVALAALGASIGLSSLLMETPVERVIGIWNQDPGIAKMRLGLAPVNGGGLLSLSGEF